MTSQKEEVKLEKKLSPLNVWALAFGCIIGWGAFVMPGNTFLGKAGPLGTAIAMGLASIVMIIIAFNYNYMISRHPVAGGEFAYAKMAFGSRHAFLCSWFLGLSYATLVPLNATALALIGRNLLNNIFQVGFHYTVAGYDIYFGELMLAFAAILLFAFFSIKGAKFSASFQVILTFILVAGVLIIAVAALLSGKLNADTLAPAYYPNSGEIAGILAVVAVAPWAFVGFDTVPQAAEEFKFPAKRTKVIMSISILFGGAVYVILNTVTAAVIPDGYANWAEYIDNVPNLKGLQSLPTFYAAYELLGNTGLVVIGLAVTAAILTGIIGFYMATSRLLYSMSKEDIIPKWFGVLHKECKTPKNAILFVMALSLLAPFFGRTALGWLVDMSSVGAAIGYGYTSAAALKYALKDKNIGIIITGAIGVCMSLVFVILLLVPIPMFHCSLATESYVCLVAWIILGLLFYVSRRKK